MREKTVHLTGHRPNALGGYDVSAEENIWLVSKARHFLGAFMLMGYDRLVSGMALGWDQWGLTVGRDLGYYTIAAIPCAEQEKLWPKESQETYRDLVAECNERHFVSTESYKPHLMQLRNVWMVDNAALTFAAYNGGKGGTYNCIKYAMQQGNLVYILDSKLRTARMVLGDKTWYLPV